MSNAKANWAELSDSPLKEAATEHANWVVGKGSKSDAWFRTAVAYFNAHQDDDSNTDAAWQDDSEESEQHLADRTETERQEAVQAARKEMVDAVLVPAGIELDSAHKHKLGVTSAYFSGPQGIGARATYKAACERYDNAVIWYNAIVAHLDTMK